MSTLAAPLLDWHTSQHFDASSAKPCALCHRSTPMRSTEGEPVHKVCAEDWNAKNPTVPRRFLGSRDMGTARFYSDPPRESKGGVS